MAFAAEIPSTGDTESLTPEEAASSVFESLLSDEPEYREEPSQTPPAQKKSPEPAKKPDTDEKDEEAPEPPQSEDGESPEQDETGEEHAEEPPASLDPSTKVKLKVNGEDVEVTLEELTKGYSRTADYTRKTQDLATNRKAFDSETAAVRQERAAIAERLKMVDDALEEIRPKEPDWDKLRVEHPTDFPRIWAEWQQNEKDRAALKQARTDAERKVAEDYQRARGERITVERQKLLEAIPDWKDEKVRAADKKAMAEYAETLGYTQEDLAAVDDHRVFLILRNAMRHSQAETKKVEAAKRIEVVRTTKPDGASSNRAPVSDYTRAVQRLAKTRSQHDLAGVFMTVLDAEDEK